MSEQECVCIVCRTRLGNIMDERGFQPDLGLAFVTYGHYGSTVFDPMDGSFLEVAICDQCVSTALSSGIIREGAAT